MTFPVRHEASCTELGVAPTVEEVAAHGEARLAGPPGRAVAKRRLRDDRAATQR